MKIAVVGSLNMDLVVRTPRLPQPGETVTGSAFATVPGGKGANQAVAAARLGAQVMMVGRVGADDFGGRLVRNLKEAGVDTQYVQATEGTASGVAVITVEAGGENTIVLAPGANARLRPADVEGARSALEECRALVTQLEIPLDTVAHALELAHAGGLLTVLNPAPAQPLPPALCPLVDWLVPNAGEASLLSGVEVKDWESAERAAAELGRQGVRGVVLTLGAQGALAAAAGRVLRVPPFAVKAVDTTAAGDAFVAALVAALAAGRELETALREASAAGALAVTRAGAQPSLPGRAEVEAFLAIWR